MGRFVFNRVKRRGRSGLSAVVLWVGVPICASLKGSVREVGRGTIARPFERDGSGEKGKNEEAGKESTVLWNLLQNPNRADRRALMVFFAIALLLSLYFASGILVGYVSPPADLIEMAKEEPGWAVRVSRLPTFDAASQLTAAIRNQRQLEAVIEGAPNETGYQVRIGPVATREMAELLAEELTTSGYPRIDILESIERDR